MSKCLVTKLKTTIDNSSLLYFNGLTIYVNTGDASYNTNSMRIYSISEIKIISEVECLSTTWDENWVNEISFSGISTICFKDLGYDYTVNINDISGIRDIYFPSGTVLTQRNWYFNIDELYSSTNIITIDIWGCPIIGNLSTLANLSNLTYIHFVYDKIVGDTSELTKKTNFTHICISSSGVTGKLSDFANNPNLCDMLFLLSKIGGSIEDFCEAHYNNGNTNKTVYLTTSSLNTFNDTAIGNNINISIKLSENSVTVSRANGNEMGTWTPTEGWSYVSESVTFE